MQDNSLTQKRLRRFQNMLIISGIGVIAFGVWSIIKSIIIARGNIVNMIHMFDEVEISFFIKVIFYIIIAALLTLDLWIRIIVGMSARSEALGKKKRRVYIVLAVILAVLSGSNFISLLADNIISGDILNSAVSLIVEGTSVFALVELIVSAIMVKRLTGAAKAQETAAAQR